jgi:hypothetical protein
MLYCRFVLSKCGIDLSKHRHILSDCHVIVIKFGGILLTECLLCHNSMLSCPTVVVICLEIVLLCETVVFSGRNLVLTCQTYVLCGVILSYCA